MTDLPRGPARRPRRAGGGGGSAARAAWRIRGWSSSSSCPRASATSTRAASPPAASRTTPGERIPIERGGQPLGMVLHDPPRPEQRDLLRRLVEAGGLAIEIARLRVELRRQLAEVEASRARIVAAGNDERRRIERDLHDGAQQRLVSIGLALRHAQHELGPASPERAGQTLDGAVAEIAVAIDELRELARGLPPSQLDAGLAPALPRARPPRAGAGRGGRAARAVRPRTSRPRPTSSPARASPTPSSTPTPPRSSLSAGRRERQLVVSVADDGVGGAIAGHGLRPERALRPRRRPRRHAADRERPGRRHDADRGAAVRVVIAEDQVLLREGLGRLFEDGGHEVVASLGDADGLLAAIAEHDPDLVVARHPDAADLHRRGRARRAGDQADPPGPRRARPLPAHRDQPRGRPRHARRLRLPAQGPRARRRRVPRRRRARRPAAARRSTRRSSPASSRPEATTTRSPSSPTASARCSS